MANHLENLARRLEADPFFLACPLKHFATSEEMTEEGLAAGLKCSMEELLQIRLCRAPAAEAEAFHNDVERIAMRFSADADVLAEAIRRGQAVYQMTQGGKKARTLLAARDRDTRKSAEDKKGDKP
jgi:hypothetical protein